MVKPRHSCLTNFREDGFDLSEHKMAADAVYREKARIKRLRRHVLIGKILLAAATVVLFFLLIFAAAQLGVLNLR